MADRDFIFGLWADAADIPLDVLSTCVGVAAEQCAAYLGEATATDAAFNTANVLWARHIYSATHGNRTEIGPDGYPVSISTWPLVLQARELLRPRTNPLGRIR